MVDLNDVEKPKYGDPNQRHTSAVQLLRRFWPYEKKYWRTMVFDLLCAALTCLCDLVLPLILRYITNTAVNDLAALTVGIVLKLALLYFVLRIIDGLAAYYMADMGHVMGVYIETDMRRDAFAHLQRLSVAYYSNNKIGQIMGRITNDLFDVTEFAHHCPEEFFIAAVKIVASFLILSRYSLGLTALLFLCVPLMMVVSVKLNTKLRATQRAQRVQVGELNAQIEESLLGERVVKAFCAEKTENEKFELPDFHPAVRRPDVPGHHPGRRHLRGQGLDHSRRPGGVLPVRFHPDRHHPAHRRVCRAVPAGHDRHRALL